LRANVVAVGLGGQVRHGAVERVLAQRPSEPFDLVVADPPYSVSGAELTRVLAALASGGWIAAGGLVVVARARRDGAVGWPDACRPLRVKRYGDTALHFAELA
jgi:16S rRNA (guanine966-N2)-methyltransferase